MRRFTAFIIILLIISAPWIVTAGGAQEGASPERGKYLAGRGIIVPSEEIYIDTYVSYIDYHYPKPYSGVGVSLYSGHRQISTEGQEEIIQIGIQGRETSFEELPPMNIAFVIDKSESMNEQDKLDWVKDAFDIFIERVRNKDFISLVVFDDEAKVIFPSTQMRSVQERMMFKDAVHSIIPGGGDNLEAGLTLGYKQVEGNFRKAYSNRVLFLSDGTGSGAEEVSGVFQVVENFNETHINLSTIGVGANYNLELMRDLADKGGGSSRFISSREEMEKTFGSDLDRTFVPTARKALYLAKECGSNVGVVIDFGHSLMAKEKPAESVVLLQMNNKLSNVHLNDAYGDWDDDLIAVSVHLQETLEFMYYLDLMKYDGWIGLDIFPFRMDGRKATELCIKNLQSLERVLDRIDREELKKAMFSLDAGNSQMVIRDAIFSD